jgi:Uncharacterised nucleotidyltransferase
MCGARTASLRRDVPDRLSTFDLIARVLAARLQRLEASDDLRAALTGRRRTYWQDVLTRARGEFVLPAFAAAMKDLDLYGALEPKVRAFLAVAHAASIQRNSKLREQLMAVVGLLNQVGIEPVLLKGGIRLVDGLYPDPGWRTMHDLDILVPEAGFASAVEALQTAGYVAVRAVDHSRKDVKLRRRGLADVEIHRELFGPARQQRLLAGAEVISGARPAAVDGATFRLPSTAHQLVHLIGHSQIGHRGHAYGRIALRDRLEAAALVRWVPDTVDWTTVFMCFAAAGYRRPLLAFLLSLSDGGLCALPVQGRIDALTALQERRIALQARSPLMTRVSLYVGWYAVLLNMQTMEHEAGRPKIVQTLKRLVLDREERRRLVRTFLHGVPRPW